jgi:hypothetical protein
MKSAPQRPYKPHEVISLTFLARFSLGPIRPLAPSSLVRRCTPGLKLFLGGQWQRELLAGCGQQFPHHARILVRQRDVRLVEPTPLDQLRDPSAA